MNGLLVPGETAHQNLQIKIEFKPEVKNYKLKFNTFRIVKFLI